MSELHRAMEAQRDAFRPGHLPAFTDLVERKRRRDRRRHVAGAGAYLAALAALAVVVPQVVGGQDTVRGTPAAPAAAPEDETFGGALVLDDNLSREHVAGRIDYGDYPARPPMGGDHSGVPQQCAVYEEQIPAEHAVHSLEHGAAWVTYRPDLPADDVERLVRLVHGDPFRLMSPLPGQQSPIVLTSWGRQLPVDSADDPLVEVFLDTYTNSRLTPERGAACVGNTTTGTEPLAVG